MKDTQHSMDSMADTLKKLYADELRFPSSKKKLPKIPTVDLSRKVRLIILLGALGVVSLLAMTVTYNQIISLREAVYSNTGRVYAEMQRRNNLFGNIVELYLSYTDLEKQIFKDVAEVRSQVAETQKLLKQEKGVTPSASAPGANKALKGSIRGIDSSLGQLMAVVEQYPNLMSFEPHKNLVNNIVLTEDRMITERGRLNASIRMYNNKIALFPYKYLAMTFGFERLAYFEPDAEIKIPPKLTPYPEFQHLRITPETEPKH